MTKLDKQFTSPTDEGAVAIPGSCATDGLFETSPVLRFAPGRIIFRKGDPASGCYMIVKGTVKVTLPTFDGQDVVLAVLGRGELVGEMALLDGRPRSATVTAVKASELRYISAADFNRVALGDGEHARHLFRLMTARLREINRAYVLQQMPMSVRLAGAFLHLMKRFGEALPGERVLIRHKVSQRELGDMIGSARENINRQLSEWRRDRVLSRFSGYYCVESPQALERLARGEPAC